VLVYPTHVAGSLCGGNIGSMLVTTIGYERKLNDMLLRLDNAEDFTHSCLDIGPLPTVPPYWRRMRRQNQEGPDVLTALVEPPALQAQEFARLLDEGAVVVDCRSPEAFAGAHIPGSLNVGVGNSFPTWAGSVLPPDKDLLLVVDDFRDLWILQWQLLRIGYREPIGWLAGGMQSWRTAAQPLGFLPQLPPRELDERRRKSEELFVLDVRQPAEWAEGHVPGAHHISGGELPQRIDDVPSDRPVAVYCGTGYRSSVAASLLRRSGHRDVYNVIGGFSAWEAAELPIQE
jgi:hydroxyacylglutathione hydrolase